MIPRDTVERIFSAARIEDVVSEHITLKKRGANYIGLCPFHEEKTGSFTVSPAKGIYKCFGCGKSGRVAQFVMDIDQCSYPEALRWLAHKYHIEIEERELTKEEQQAQDDRASMFVVNEFACKWYEDQLWNTSEGQAVGLSYLHKRGVTDDTIRKFHLGYSPKHSKLYTEARTKGFQDKYLLNDADHEPHIGTGICCPSSKGGQCYDRFSERVIFPFYSPSGKVVGFAGRALGENYKGGKYTNSPTSPLYEKRNELFGLHQAKQSISQRDMCYLVEGQLDMISLYQAGICNVVSSGGTSLTHEQVRLMHRFTNHVTILYDGDKAGIKAAERGVNMMLEEGILVKVVLFPDGDDPDSYVQKHNASEVIEFLDKNQVDFIRFRINLLSEDVENDPISKAELVRSVVESIAVIPDAITRQMYIKSSAGWCHLDEAFLTREVAKLRSSKKKEREEKQRHAEETVSTVPTPTVPNAATSTTPTKETKDIFNQNMLNLLRLVVRYGDKAIYQDQNGEPIQAGQYIVSNLQASSITPRKELHQRLLDEYMTHCMENGFEAASFFRTHPDIEINTLAADLDSDRYQLSRIYNKQTISENVSQEVRPTTDLDVLPDITNRLLMELQFTVVEERIRQVKEQIDSAHKENDFETQMQMLTVLPQLEEARQQLCKELGNRVIV